MTSDELIAMLFPLGAPAVLIVGGLIAKYIWVDRPRARETSAEVELYVQKMQDTAPKVSATPMNDRSNSDEEKAPAVRRQLTEALAIVDRIMGNARTELEEAQGIVQQEIRRERAP